MLDFTALNNIAMQRAIQDFTEPLEPTAGNLALKPEKPATGEIISSRGHIHNHKLDAEKRERERLREMYSTYQENIKKAGSCRSDLLKGIKQGEDPLALLLTAVECISLMTGDTVIYTQAKEDITAIYGWGLGYKQPLHRQLREARERLERLKSATVQPEDTQRLDNAIKAHEELIALLQAQMKRENTEKGYTPIQEILEDVVEELRTKQTHA